MTESREEQYKTYLVLKALFEKEKIYEPGTLVYLKQSVHQGPLELLTILWWVDPDEDEADDKYLVRTTSHSKKTVFHCEIIPVDQYKPSSTPPQIDHPR